MIIFIKGSSKNLHNRKQDGIMFSLGQGFPRLGKFVSRFQSIWKSYIG